MFRRYGMGSFSELLELFYMGVGNYTEQDVYEASRAFTGWTIQD